MHTSISKNKAIFRKNYPLIYDVNHNRLKLIFFTLFLLLLFSIRNGPNYNYLHSLYLGYKLKGTDNMYDYYVPLCSALFIIYTFFYEYDSESYKYIAYINRNNFNYIMLYRWLLSTLIFVLGSFITGLIYYRDISFLDLTNIILSIRFIPNILFLASIALLIATIFKNIYASILLLSTYYCIDLYSSGNIFKLLSIGANSNNFYYTHSPKYYIINRVMILFLSIIFLLISCKKSSKI